MIDKKTDTKRGKRVIMKGEIFEKMGKMILHLHLALFQAPGLARTMLETHLR